MLSRTLLLLAVVALLVSLSAAQTQINVCWLSYSPLNTLTGSSSAGLFWSSQLVATLTLNTATPVASLGTSGYLVTAATGTRAVASLAGTNALGSVTTVNLTSRANCPNGCDNMFYPAGNSGGGAGAGGYFDGDGISFTLSTGQVDNQGCDTLTFKIQGNAAYGSALGNVSSDCGSEVDVFGLVATYPVNSPLPAICQYSTIPAITNVTCGIGAYNFAPMATYPDLVGSFSGYALYVRLCGAVSQGNCVSQFGNNVMACQLGSSSPTLGYLPAYPQAFTYSNNASASLTFAYVNGVDGTAGFTFRSGDGALCDSGPRVFKGTLLCGAQAAIISYAESPSCTYTYTITTPLACPPTQNLAFCQLSSTTPVPAYNTWMTAISGIVSATAAPASQQANFGQAGVTYIAQSFLSSPPATIQFSQTYLATPANVTNPSGYALINSPTGIGYLPSASLSLTGAVAATYPITIAAVGSYNGNDNVLYYINGSTSGWVTNGGLSFAYGGSNNSQVYFSTSTTAVNIYYDSYIGPGTSYYSQVQVVPLGSSTTLPAGWCTAPTLTTGQTAGTAQTFGFCLITYATGIYAEYTSSYFYASITTGTITASSTANQGQYQVSAISGQRTTSSSLGVATSTGTPVTVSLGGSSSTPQYVYYSSPLVSGTTDGITGLTFQLATNQTDPSGCSGGTVQILGQAVICGLASPNGGNNYPSYQTTFTLSPGGTVPSCTPLTQSIQPYVCGIGQYDFSSLASGSDLNFTQNGYTVYFHPCGPVQQPSCVATYGSNTMACQYTSPSQLYELAAYQSPYGSPEFSYVNGIDGNAGVLMVMADGLLCNDDVLYPRQLYVTYLCGAASSGTKLVYYAEWSANGGAICHYNLTVITPLACGNTIAPTLASNTTCSIGNYNFTQLATTYPDMAGSFAGYGIFMRLCGAVQQPWCITYASGPTQVCQFYSYQYLVTGMAYTGYGSTGNNLQLSYANGVDGSQGINYVIANGDQCGSAPRIVQGTITCGVESGMTSYAENPACTYNINVSTPLACNGGVGSSVVPPGSVNTVQFAFCLTVANPNFVPGYSVVQSQMTGVLTAVQQSAGSTVYVVTGATGTRSVLSVNGSVVSTATITGLSNSLGASQLLYYVPTSNLAYIDTQGVAVQLSVSQNDGTGCVGSSIALYYGQIGCGNGFFSLSGYSLSLVPLVGSAVAPACTLPTYNFEVPPFCGVGQYSLASLANGPDLSFTGGGYTIYMRLCGVVSQPDCVSTYGPNIQICQWGSSSSQYEIAALYAPGNETTFAYANGQNINQGLSYVIKDGGLCGSIPRSVSGIISCGAVNNITNYYQLSGVTCQYSINLTSPLVCVSGTSTGGGGSPTSSTGQAGGTTAVSSSSSAAAGTASTISNSSSSGLSHGAIAGIVIGSVVGALILLGCFACMFGVMSRREKGVDKGNSGESASRGGQSYNEVEPSRNMESVNQSQVEMGHVTNEEGH